MMMTQILTQSPVLHCETCEEEGSAFDDSKGDDNCDVSSEDECDEGSI